MRREHKNDLPREQIIHVKCCRQDHVIRVTAKGQVCFESHGNLPLKLLVHEGSLSGNSHKGCYLFADALLGKLSRRTSEFVLARARRTSSLAALHRGGVGDNAAYILSAAFHRSARRAADRVYHDDYPEPFHKIPSQRVGRLYAAMRRAQDEKLQRVVAGLRKAGFEPEPSWALPSYRR